MMSNQNFATTNVPMGTLVLAIATIHCENARFCELAWGLSFSLTKTSISLRASSNKQGLRYEKHCFC
jgi:hypothetical protein